MAEVDSFEAKTHLPQLLDRVAKGEEIVITKRGVPVAKLVPVSTETLAERRRHVIDAVRRWRERPGAPRASLEEIREWIREGRR